MFFRLHLERGLSDMPGTDAKFGGGHQEAQIGSGAIMALPSPAPSSVVDGHPTCTVPFFSFKGEMSGAQRVSTESRLNESFGE